MLTDAERRRVAGLADEAGRALREIQRIIGNRSAVTEARVAFPPGFLDYANDYLHSLPALGSATKRRNLAYRLLMADVLQWLLRRMKVWGQVRSSVVYEYICILGFGAEFLVKECTRNNVGRRHRLCTHTQWLVNKGFIEAALKCEIDWLWEVRTTEHLDALDVLDHDSYNLGDSNRAEKAWSDLLQALDANYREILVEIHGPPR